MNSIELKPIVIWIPIWLGLFLLAWVFYQKQQPQPELIHSQEPTTIIIDGKKIIKITADAIGQYRFTGSINGKKVTFLVDTGASTVALPQTIADALFLIKGPEVLVTTASDRVKGYRTLLKTITIAGATFNDTEAIVIDNMPGKTVLLGMNLLKTTSFSQQQGDLLIEYPL